MLAAYISVRKYAPCLVDSEILVFLAFSISVVSCNSSTSSSTGFPKFRVEEFDAYIQFRLNLHIMSCCGSLHLYPLAAKKKPLWWKLDKALIYEYSRISFGVILSLFCRPLVFGFTLGLWAYPNNVGHGFSPLKLALSQIRHWLATPTSSVLPWK